MTGLAGASSSAGRPLATGASSAVGISGASSGAAVDATFDLHGAPLDGAIDTHGACSDSGTSSGTHSAMNSVVPLPASDASSAGVNRLHDALFGDVATSSHGNGVTGYAERSTAISADEGIESTVIRSCSDKLNAGMVIETGAVHTVPQLVETFSAGAGTPVSTSRERAAACTSATCTSATCTSATCTSATCASAVRIGAHVNISELVDGDSGSGSDKHAKRDVIGTEPGMMEPENASTRTHRHSFEDYLSTSSGEF